MFPTPVCWELSFTVVLFKSFPMVCSERFSTVVLESEADGASWAIRCTEVLASGEAPVLTCSSIWLATALVLTLLVNESEREAVGAGLQFLIPDDCSIWPYWQVSLVVGMSFPTLLSTVSASRGRAVVICGSVGVVVGESWTTGHCALLLIVLPELSACAPQEVFILVIVV